MSKLIIGLGNPGEKYKNTPHNLGKDTVEYLREKFDFPAFKEKKNLLSSISFSKINGEKIILTLPLVFMNESGRAVIALKNFLKIDEENLWVIHDDLDIEWGKIKIVKNRGAAGHHGVESIIQFLKTKNFWRIRIGIKTQKISLSPKIYVLKKIPKNKQKEKEEIAEQIVKIFKRA